MKKPFFAKTVHYSFFLFERIRIFLFSFFYIFSKKMPQMPFALKWTIPEYSLYKLKYTINCLLSTSVSNIPEFEYYLSIFPNGFDEKNRGKTWIGLQLTLKDVKQVKADFKILIESQKYSFEKDVIYEESTGFGEFVAGTGKFFSSKFISHGKLTIKIQGIFKFERKTNIPINVKELEFNGKKLWKNDGDKEFTIFVENKEIKNKIEAVCFFRLTDFSIRLYSKCFQFMKVCFLSNTCRFIFLNESEILDARIFYAVQKFHYQIVETEKFYPF